jgi:hypothetical protein
MMEMDSELNPLERAVKKYIFHVERLVVANHQALGGGIPGTPAVTFSVGPKFARVIISKGGGQRCAHTFIDTTNGNILNAEGWKKPGKRVCGSVYAERVDGYGVSHFGAVYLK